MTPVTSASLAALVASAAASAAPQLQLGDVLTGIVIAAFDDAVLRLQLPAGTIDVATDTPLAPGTRVTLAVEGTSQQPKLVLSPIADEPGARPSQAINPSGTGVATRIAPANVAQAVAVTSLASRSQQAPGPVDGGAALIAGATNAARGASPSITPENPPVLAPDPSSAAATIVRTVARQGGFDPLYADLEAMLRQPNLAAPAPVVDAARQLFALRLDIRGDDGVRGNDIESALARSGIATDFVAPKELPASGVPDLGTGLGTLRRALKDWLDTEPLARPVSSPPSVRPSEPQPASRAAAPMPPYRNAPTVPQAAVAPSIAVGDAPREWAARLLDHTEAAIARQSLLQIASLPDHPTTGASHADNNGMRLTFDIPLATIQGTAVAQVRIEHDGGGHDERTIAPVWRANFSIDLEPIGRVHARIALVGDRATVTLNAERPASADELSAGFGLLEAGLRDADLEPGELRCNAGAPRTAPAAPGLFVDHAT